MAAVSSSLKITRLHKSHNDSCYEFKRSSVLVCQFAHPLELLSCPSRPIPNTQLDCVARNAWLRACDDSTKRKVKLLLSPSGSSGMVSCTAQPERHHHSSSHRSRDIDSTLQPREVRLPAPQADEAEHADPWQSRSLPPLPSALHQPAQDESTPDQRFEWISILCSYDPESTPSSVLTASSNRPITRYRRAETRRASIEPGARFNTSLQTSRASRCFPRTAFTWAKASWFDESLSSESSFSRSARSFSRMHSVTTPSSASCDQGVFLNLAHLSPRKS